VEGKVSYDEIGPALRFVGVMASGERDLLLSLSLDAEYRQAIDQLFRLSTEIADESKTYEVTLESLPHVRFPEVIEGSISYDRTAQRLHFHHVMTPDEKTLLLSLGYGEEYEVAVAALYNQPDELRGQLVYDKQRKILRGVGAMTKARKEKLQALSTNEAYRQAVDALYQAPRRFIARQMRTFVPMDFTVALASLPDQVRLPESQQHKVYYDAVNQQLHFIGAMTDIEHEELLKLSPDSEFKQAVNRLYELPESVPLDESFLGKDDAASFFDTLRDDGYPKTAVQRFTTVLERLVPYLRTTLSERLVKQKIGEALKLDQQMASELLTRWVNAIGQPNQKAMADFLMPAFVESNPNLPVSRAAFRPQFDTWIRLHKIAGLIAKFRISPQQLPWLFTGDPAAHPAKAWLNLNVLPLTPTATTTAFPAWQRLMDLFRLRDNLPQGERLLNEIFAGATRTSGTVESG
jgi:hypothetical protein